MLGQSVIQGNQSLTGLNSNDSPIHQAACRPPGWAGTERFAPGAPLQVTSHSETDDTNRTEKHSPIGSKRRTNVGFPESSTWARFEPTDLRLEQSNQQVSGRLFEGNFLVRLLPWLL